MPKPWQALIPEHSLFPKAGPVEEILTNTAKIPPNFEPADVKYRDFEGVEKEELPERLLRQHGIEPEKQVAWRCIPMEELNPSGSDIASRAGAAPVGLAMSPSGLVWRIPAEPPTYENIEATDPAAGLCHPRHPCKDMAKKILKDPAGIPYWVITSQGGKPDEEMDSGPVSQNQGVMMSCQPNGRTERYPHPPKQPEMEIFTPGLGAIPKFLKGAGAQFL
ncbi:unnamed protein product [Cladocopium goreaui]|uniref:Uncharacterized protein n=1 Tax=Cladocopium goreaui TaxID=2562237 RepID=A0A9P1D4S0_9DINO|nr:unnamed protein product [Cladocopium goreaui]